MYCLVPCVYNHQTTLITMEFQKNVSFSRHVNYEWIEVQNLAQDVKPRYAHHITLGIER